MVQKVDLPVKDKPTAVNTTRNYEFLNAYDILNLERLCWDVTTYKVIRLDGYDADHEDRGKITDIIWQLRFKFKERCRGSGFIFAIDDETVVVSSNWDLPDQERFEGYRVKSEHEFKARATNPKHQQIIEGILRESIKTVFKNEYSDELGPLWRDYRDFCQMPQLQNDQNVIFCRKFKISPKYLKGGRWVIQIVVSTRSVDSHSFHDYYKQGEVEKLAEMIELKRKNRRTRKNKPISIRVLQISSRTNAQVLELEKPEDINEHAQLDPADQKNMASQPVSCVQFKKPPRAVPMSQIRLVLDSQITQEDHDETIINPDDRMQWQNTLRDFFDEMEAYGVSIQLNANPAKIDDFDTLFIKPPTIQVRASKNRTKNISTPQECTRNALKKRGIERARAIRDHGFLEHRPINPLLACPKQFGERRASRLQSKLNWMFQKYNVDYKFGKPYLYKDVKEIKKKVEQGEYNTVFAVLPEGRRKAYTNNNTHERIKRMVPVPSQCIHHDNTVPYRWGERPWTDFEEENGRLAQRIENNYRQCLSNLLVKHNWVPFAPVDPFYYNIHVGIDVGGQHNNRIMVCVGYGMANPKGGLIFLPKEINIDTQQVEPIPVDYLYNGLYSLFEELYEYLTELGETPDFNRTLFFRDGELRGKGDEWNEIDALLELRQKLFQMKWIGQEALWTATEVSKRAGYWRVLRQDNQIVRNPIIGRCVFPFEDENTALVCTTGSPYLSQGTASPLLVRIKDIYGQASREEILQDLVWEADMCFTKVDIGMSLPWVLHVANTGALQQSKAYHITGITV